MGRFILLLLLSSSVCLQSKAGSGDTVSAAEKPPFILQGVDSPETRQRIRTVVCQAWADAEILLGEVRLNIPKPLTLEITFTAKKLAFPCIFRKQTPAGILHTAENRAVLRLNKEIDLRSQQIIRHEIAHWLLRQYWKEYFSGTNKSPFPLPRWLDEGIACLLEIPLNEEGRTQWHPARCRQFLQLAKRRKSEVLFTRILLPADKKKGFSSDEYAFSWALVFHLSQQRHTSNISALHNLLHSVRQLPHSANPEQLYYRTLFRIVDPPVDSPKKLLRHIQTRLENRQPAP